MLNERNIDMGKRFVDVVCSIFSQCLNITIITIRHCKSILLISEQQLISKLGIQISIFVIHVL